MYVDGHINMEDEKCSLQYKTDTDKFSKLRCYVFSTQYDAANCDPLLFNGWLCALKKKGLLKSDNTLNDVAFQNISLRNKCSTDTNFSQAYPNCKSSTMKYLNILRLLFCLFRAVP
ncbi:uncharacterized protein LOC108675915 [Hyalella azteca]|uniref:Uncharacterized protein LOC108675915 n=1 Tax=Hyalella azteca TaxID=294128 RepID=A0A8B7P357_HYAAZ|nr:uncharacterized protein LOC108675915 [Hyalella azteca]